MASERIREQHKTLRPVKHGPTETERPPQQQGRTYRLGPADLEEFIALGAEAQHRLIETPGAIEEWLAEHSAKYA